MSLRVGNAEVIVFKASCVSALYRADLPIAVCVLIVKRDGALLIGSDINGVKLDVLFQEVGEAAVVNRKEGLALDLVLELFARSDYQIR